MSAAPVVLGEGVSKKFSRSLGRMMRYGIADIARNAVGLGSRSGVLREEEFWAVDDVSFGLERGESLGLIGPNGSGKSTLLKMLHGIYWPDRGRISIRGRVGALIEVGAGFHPMLTGRDNVFLNGAILGMSRQETARKFDEIVAFAEIGSFIDSPVKFYSSGMFVRLGFAVAVHCDPEILLVDEVLAVGDTSFQIRCYRKMHEIRKRGTTIILVAHNDYTIREQTRSCLYLREGRVRYLGPTEDALNAYIRDRLEARPRPEIPGGEAGSPQPGRAALGELVFLDGQGRPTTFVESGGELNVVLECLLAAPLESPVFSINFYGEGGFFFCLNSEYEEQRFPAAQPGPLRVKVAVPHLHLPVGTYVVSTVLAEESSSNLLDWQEHRYTLVVGRARNARGSVRLPASWSLERG